jgi:hypothetical protein
VFTHGEEICSLNVYLAVRRSHVYERKRSEGEEEGGGGEEEEAEKKRRRVNRNKMRESTVVV